MKRRNSLSSSLSLPHESHDHTLLAWRICCKEMYFNKSIVLYLVSLLWGNRSSDRALHAHATGSLQKRHHTAQLLSARRRRHFSEIKGRHCKNKSLKESSSLSVNRNTVVWSSVTGDRVKVQCHLLDKHKNWQIQNKEVDHTSFFSLYINLKNERKK